MVSSQSQPRGFDSDHGDAAFLALKELLEHQEDQIGLSAPHADAYGSSDNRTEDSHAHPAIAALELSIDGDDRRADFRNEQIFVERRSVARRVLRTAVYGFVVILIVAPALAWRSSDHTTKDIVRAWGSSLSRLPAMVGIELSPGSKVSTAEPATNNSDQVATRDTAVPQAAPITPSAPAPVAVRASSELQQRLESMDGDVTALRRVVEGFAAKQEHMAQDIAALQAAQQTLSQKISSLNQPTVVSVPPHKNAARAMHSAAAVEPTSVPIPPVRPQLPLALH